MKSAIISLLFVALLASAQTTTSCKVANYYYDSESKTCVYCTPADAGKVGCKCAVDETYIDGYCINLDEVVQNECSDIVRPGMTRSRKCTSGFGTTVRYCSAVANNHLVLVMHEVCYSDEDLEYGASLVFAKVSFTNMPIHGITAAAKAKIISALVATFPFMVGDVDFGAIYLDESVTEGQTPITIMEMNIHTQKKYLSIFKAAEEEGLEDNDPATVFTNYLHTYAEYIFETGVEASFVSMEPITREATCVDNGITYQLGESIYRECSADSEFESDSVVGHEKTTCKADIDGGVWSEYSKADCLDLQTYIDEGKNVAAWEISFDKLPYGVLNYNLTKALYPIFIETISTDIRGIKIFDLAPKFTVENSLITVDSSSSRLLLEFDTTNDCMSGSKLCITQANENIESSKTALIDKIKAIDSVKFNGVSIDVKLVKTEPSAPTTAPTSAPTTAPTSAPTTAPTSAPTSAPTTAPTTAPSAIYCEKDGNKYAPGLAYFDCEPTDQDSQMVGHAKQTCEVISDVPTWKDDYSIFHCKDLYLSTKKGRYSAVYEFEFSGVSSTILYDNRDNIRHAFLNAITFTVSSFTSDSSYDATPTFIKDTTTGIISTSTTSSRMLLFLEVGSSCYVDENTQCFAMITEQFTTNKAEIFESIKELNPAFETSTMEIKYVDDSVQN